MTVKEAEKRFEAEKRAYEKQFEKFAKKVRIAGGMIGSVLLIVGIVLLIVGATKPPVVQDGGHGHVDNITEYIYGGLCLGWGALIILTVVPLFPLFMKKKYRVYILATKNLYKNYLSCTDMDDADKETYRKKLENLKNADAIEPTLYSRLHK